MWGHSASNYGAITIFTGRFALLYISYTGNTGDYLRGVSGAILRAVEGVILLSNRYLMSLTSLELRG